MSKLKVRGVGVGVDIFRGVWQYAGEMMVTWESRCFICIIISWAESSTWSWLPPIMVLGCKLLVGCGVAVS